MKNRFFVGIELLISFACLLILDIVGFVVGVVCGGLPDNGYLSALCISIFSIVTFILIICLLLSCEVIEITEDGISKNLFGKRLKFFKWEEIIEIKGRGNVLAPTITFFRNRSINSFLYRFMKREKIFFSGGIKKTDILKRYAPAYVIEKVFCKNNEYVDDAATLKNDSVILPSKSENVRNKFYACFYVVPLAVAIFVLSVGGFFIGVAIAGFPKPLSLLITMIILLLALPSVLLVLGLFIGLQMIEITERGISLSLFGKKIKYFKWEEISNAKIEAVNKGDRQAVSFYKIKENSKSNRKERISFTYYSTDVSKIMILKHYVPDYIIDKLNHVENK